MTNRTKDISDLIILFNQGLDFRSIIDECEMQHQKNIKWIFWLYESLLRLNKLYDINIPEESRIKKIIDKNKDFKPTDFPNLDLE